MVLKYNAKTGKYEDDGKGAPKTAYPTFSANTPSYDYVSGATTANADLPDPSKDSSYIDVGNTDGTGSGSRVSNADGRRGANQAARIQRRAGLRGQQEYNQASQDVYGKYLEAIAPLYAQQEQATATQKAAAMELLNKQLEMAQANITRANQDFTAGAVPSAAYSAAPIMQMSPQQNMLAAGIQGFGASMDPVAQQSASDAEYARATAELARRSAEQLNQGQQNYMNAYKQQGASDLNQTQQQLALQQLLGTSNIDAEAMKSLNEITGNKSQAQVQGLDLQLGLIQKGIEAAMAGRQSAAETRAAGMAKYGMPAKKKNTGRKK